MGFRGLFRFLLVPCTVAAFANHVSIRNVAQTSLFATARETFQLVVTYQGQSCEVDVYPDETILAALERNGVMDTLCLPTVPAECRRGNCMTCAGRLLGENNDQLLRGEDGLAPYVSDILQSSDYVLTCSSFVKGDGLRIELGQNSDLWEKMYHDRFVSREAHKTKLETVAKLHRLRAESDVPKWTAETEEVLKKSGD